MSEKRGSHLKGIERNSCATCIFIELDPKWEIKKIPKDMRNTCTNKDSLEYTNHVNFKNLCRKHVKNQKWVKVPK